MVVSTLLFLLAKVWPYLILIGAGAVWGIRQRRAGRAEVRAEQAKADQRARDLADEIQNDVGSMSPELIEAELRKRALR
jgi:hypothetical protein